MHRVFLGPALCVVAITLAVPSEADQLAVNGQMRTYVLERPATKGPQPTIIVLHGPRGTGASIAQSTKLGTLAPQQGFVAVFPDALRPHWNFFLPGKELEFYVKASKAAGGVADDGAFLKGLVADLVQRGVADPRRIYLAGESSGSLMALRMLCTDAGLFAGSALLGAAMPERVGSDCRPSQPVPVLLVKGTSDEIFPYAGGLIKPEETFDVWGNDHLVDFLKRVNNHSGPPQRSLLPRTVPNTVSIDRWLACSGTMLTVYRVIDGPHVAPADLNVGQVTLDFFSSPMRSSSCVASSQPGGSAGPATSPDTNAGANPNSSAGTPGANPNGQGGTPGTKTNSAGSPNTATPGTDTNAAGNPSTATTDPGSGGNTPGNGMGPTASDPNAPAGPNSSSLGGPGGDTGGLGPPTDPNNAGTDTAGLGPPPDSTPQNPTGALGPPTDPNNPATSMAGLGPPPDNTPQNPTGGLGPPPDQPASNPPIPGPTTVMLPPPVYPPVYIPVPGNVCNPRPPMPGNVCHPTPSKPGNVCNPKPPNVCNPKPANVCKRPPVTATAPTPANPCAKPTTPLTLRPNPGTQTAVAPPPNAGILRLRPAEPQSSFTPASVASTGPVNPCLPKISTTKAISKDPPRKKKETQKMKPKHDNSDANNARNAAAAAATAAAIISIVGGMQRHGGGGGSGSGYRGNPCHPH